jgi:hypothetical protein
VRVCVCRSDVCTVCNSGMRVVLTLTKTTRFDFDHRPSQHRPTHHSHRSNPPRYPKTKAAADARNDETFGGGGGSAAAAAAAAAKAPATATTTAGKMLPAFFEAGGGGAGAVGGALGEDEQEVCTALLLAWMGLANSTLVDPSIDPFIHLSAHTPPLPKQDRRRDEETFGSAGADRAPAATTTTTVPGFLDGKGQAQGKKDTSPPRPAQEQEQRQEQDEWARQQVGSLSCLVCVWHWCSYPPSPAACV